ncbi:MAG: hypothetical protein AAFR36_31660 [Bacteroidota bacterium]
MELTAEEFVRKEFEDFHDMSQEDWVRKMEEFAVLKNASIDLEYILELPTNNKFALENAISALYFNDRSDYKKYLHRIVVHLSGISMEQLNEDLINAMYKLLNP